MKQVRYTLPDQTLVTSRGGVHYTLTNDFQEVPDEVAAELLLEFPGLIAEKEVEAPVEQVVVTPDTEVTQPEAPTDLGANAEESTEKVVPVA
jgi:hypothetical protein